MKDYFADLELESSATLEDVRKSYRRLARLHHPDNPKGDPEIFQRIHEAYRHLNSEESLSQVRETLEKLKEFAEHPKVKKYRDQPEPDEAKESSIMGEDGHDRVENLDIRILVTTTKENGEFQYVAISVEVPCEGCRGIGGNPGEKRVRCENCSGLGYLMIKRGESFRWKKTCEHCHGVGSKVQNVCESCGGYGKSLRRERISLEVANKDGAAVSYPGKGHFSFDGKTRGTLWITWQGRVAE